MHLDPLDSSFRAYQQQRDPAALAAVFDAAAPRLLLVAMHLVRDAATAEDLVQTVFLQVLRDAGSCQPGRPVLPWLLGMLEHRAIDARRRAHVRREQGGAEAFGAARGVAAVAATPPDLAADAECRQLVSEALAGMPREYREVLTLRLVHGLAAVDIAHSLGLAPATVRMRASRGLKLLRSALPRGLATPALLAWLGAESLRANDGLQAVRAKVLAAAGGGVAATFSGLWLGGIVVLLMIAIGAWRWSGSGATPFAPAAAPAPAVVAAERGAARDAERDRDSIARDLVANDRSAASDSRRTSLRGTVVAAETGLPLAGVEVRVQLQPKAGRGLAAAHDAPPTIGTALDGGFECAFVPPPDCFVALQLLAPGRLPERRSFASLRQGVSADLGAIPLAAGTPVVLQLRRAGRPLAGIDVDLHMRGEDRSSRPLGIERTDAAGRVDLGTVAPGAYEHEVRVALPGSAGRFVVPLQASPLEVAIELGEPDRAGSITGVAVRPDGLPFAGVKLGVPAGNRYGGHHTCSTDSEGRFVFVRSELSPPQVPITLWSSQPELELLGERAEIAWGSHDVRLVVQPRPTGTLRVRCVDAETGAPVTTFGATCWLDPWAAGTRDGPRLAAAPRVEHPDGVCTLTNLVPGVSFLSVFPPAPYADCCERPVTIRPGQQELQVALHRPVVCRVQAVDVGDGTGVAGVEIALARVLPLRDHADVDLTTYRVDLTGGREDLSYSTGTNVLVIARGRTDGDGVVQLSVPPDLPGLVLLAEGPHCIGAIRHDVSVVEDGATVTIAVARAASLHGKVTPIDLVTRFGPAAEDLAALAERARVQHVDETELAKDYPSLLLRRVDAEQRELAALLGSDGSFRLGGVPPGRYEAWLDVATRCDGTSYGTRLGPLATLTVRVEPPQDALHLDGSRWLPGRIDLRMLVDGAPFQGTVSLRSERLHLRYTTDGAGRVRSDWLPPDTYLAGIELPGAGTHGSVDPRPLVVVAGGQLEAVASVVRRPVRVTLLATASGAPVADAWLLLRALDHPLLHDDLVVARTGADGVAEFRAAPPGRLQVAMLTAAQIDARQLEAAIPLGQLSPADTALRCTLSR